MECAFSKGADAEFGIGAIKIDLDRAAHQGCDFGHWAQWRAVDGALEGFQQQRLGFAFCSFDGATAIRHQCRNRVQPLDDASLFFEGRKGYFNCRQLFDAERAISSGTSGRGSQQLFSTLVVGKPPE